MKNKNYPLYEVEPISNLKELINHIAEKYGDNPAFTFERKKEIVNISYCQFKADVDALGTALFDLGIRNAKVAVIGENSYEWILTYFAIVNSGNVIVPLDKELPAADIRNLVDHSEAEVFVYSYTYSDITDYLRENCIGIKHFINMNSLPELTKKGNLLIQQGEESVVNFEVDNYALTALLYTSGTTGNAKGVMLTHYGIAGDAIAACQFVNVIESNLLVLPLHHTLGMVAICTMLVKKSEIYINSSLKNILHDLKKYRPSNIFLVPLFVETFYKQIWENAKSQNKDNLLRKMITFSNALRKTGIDIRRLLFKSVLNAFGGNLSLIICGGAPLDTKYIHGFRDIGIDMLIAYGITECSPAVSINRNRYHRDGSVGLVLNCYEVKIVEPDENGYGEIYVKGDTLMLGYYKNEQTTIDAFDGDWFKTGDIGYLDRDGFLYLCGRKKNVIILNNGENVYPEELEFALANQIPYIKEVVVYAEDNLIVAEAFLDTESFPDCASLLGDDIVELNRTLPPYKNVGKTVIRDKEFPKTTTKKIKRQY